MRVETGERANPIEEMAKKAIAVASRNFIRVDSTIPGEEHSEWQMARPNQAIVVIPKNKKEAAQLAGAFREAGGSDASVKRAVLDLNKDGMVVGGMMRTGGVIPQDVVIVEDVNPDEIDKAFNDEGRLADRIGPIKYGSMEPAIFVLIMSPQANRRKIWNAVKKWQENDRRTCTPRVAYDGKKKWFER